MGGWREREEGRKKSCLWYSENSACNCLISNKRCEVDRTGDSCLAKQPAEGKDPIQCMPLAKVDNCAALCITKGRQAGAFPSSKNWSLIHHASRLLVLPGYKMFTTKKKKASGAEGFLDVKQVLVVSVLIVHLALSHGCTPPCCSSCGNL